MMSLEEQTEIQTFVSRVVASASGELQQSIRYETHQSVAARPRLEIWSKNFSQRVSQQVAEAVRKILEQELSKMPWYVQADLEKLGWHSAQAFLDHCEKTYLEDMQAVQGLDEPFKSKQIAYLNAVIAAERESLGLLIQQGL